jgi:small-conductance mechanosensitive channel
MDISRITMVLALILPILSTNPVSAQSQQTDPKTQSEASAPSALAAGWSDQLDKIAGKLGEPNPSDALLSDYRVELEAIRRNIRKWIPDQTPKVAAAKKELDALGPPPAKGAPPEAADVAAQRKELTDRWVKIQGEVKKANVALGRTTKLLTDISDIRRNRFVDRIMIRGPSPLSPALWSRALPEIVSISESLIDSVIETAKSDEFRRSMRDAALPTSIAVILAIILAWPLRRWILRRFGRDPQNSQPGFMDAMRATLVVGATRAFLPTAAAAIVYMVVITENLLVNAGKDIAEAVLLAFVLFTWTLAFFRASLSPTRPAWRIVSVPTRFARGIRGAVIGLALTFAAHLVLSEIIAVYGARLAVAVVRDYGLTIIVTGFLLFPMLRQRMWISEEDPEEKPRWRSLRILFAIALVTLPILGAFGYVALSRFIVTQFVMTGGLLLFIMIVHRLGREFINQAVATENWLGERLRIALRMEEISAIRIQFWVGLAYDAVLIALGVIIGLFVWGADSKDVGEWLYQAFFGFKIGQFTFSFFNLAVAILVFVVLITVTRFIQRILSEQVLPQTALDTGLQQSIHISVGYVGIVIAAIAAIAAVGFDLSNFAIVVGALSVGIGFGLQNVVNNFVSGLILLAERPVKVGDRIIVGDQQGIVKRIKVRATEIQTFDRANVFVPNSEFISKPVTNLTYADKMGRIIIPVGVAYGSDTRKVRDTLLKIASEHPGVLKDPAPSAVFRGFGDSALNLELRCFLEEVEKAIGVTSDICFSIDDEFRKEGIEIPFPQRDVNLKQTTQTAP